MFGYYALFEPDRRGGFAVTFPGLNHGGTQGETMAEALEMAADLLRSIVAELMKRGAELPRPIKYRAKNHHLISLPALQAAKAELYREFRASGVKKSELARRIGIPKTNIERLFDLDHASRLDQIEAAFRALGKKIDVHISDAA